MKTSNNTVAFFTLGCKLNYAESSTLARQFAALGYQRVQNPQEASVCVINSCAVTRQAEKKCRQLIKKIILQAPSAFIIVTGCFAQLQQQQIASIQGVHLVIGTGEKFDIPAYIEQYQQATTSICHTEQEKLTSFYAAYSSDDRSRSFLKVQDGCDYHCAYCTIPHARGNSRNDPIKEIVAVAREIEKKKIGEIVITGVNIGDFGRTSGETFLDLLQALVQDTAVPRFRISSIEPNLLNDKIIDFVASTERIAHHFHIPLQAGSDYVLQAMRRRYSVACFVERVAAIKTAMPHACIGADVIVGFPGENDAHFRESYALLESLDISYLHVFPFSPRQHTPAASFSAQVDGKTKNVRSKQLIELSTRKKRLFYEHNIGRKEQVVFETRRKNNTFEGFTGNYIKVMTDAGNIQTGKLTEVRLLSVMPGGNVKVEII